MLQRLTSSLIGRVSSLCANLRCPCGPGQSCHTTMVGRRCRRAVVGWFATIPQITGRRIPSFWTASAARGGIDPELEPGIATSAARSGWLSRQRL
jgi:hypothetical protein